LEKNISKVYVSKRWRSASWFWLGAAFSTPGLPHCQQEQYILLGRTKTWTKTPAWRKIQPGVRERTPV